MIHHIELAEYETKEVRLDAGQARRLASAAQNALDVRHAEGSGAYRVGATNFVGTLVVDDLKVLIRPKIRLENLFLMLEAGLPRQAWRQEAFEYAVSGDLLSAMVAFYARTLETTLARGLLRSYRLHEEALVALRGRVDVTAQFRQGGVQLPVPCRYDEHTIDIAENIFLKAAARHCLRLRGVHPEDRQRLLRQLAEFEGVTDRPVRAADLDQLHETRLNAHYWPALRLARLLLESRSLADQWGDRATSSFLVDMNRLFEDFITGRLRRELQGRVQVKSQHWAHLAEGDRVPIRPDLVFWRQDKPAYVADIKYKLTGDARARPSDYYQLLAYTTALGLPEGMLIYCHADEGAPESIITVRHAGKRLLTTAISLQGSPDEVAESVEELAATISRRIDGGLSLAGRLVA
ncbi:MAG: hypothetical protein OXT07_09415 [bacterium]|nr:hypothetical protein [bacterium]